MSAVCSSPAAGVRGSDCIGMGTPLVVCPVSPNQVSQLKDQNAEEIYSRIWPDEFGRHRATLP